MPSRDILSHLSVTLSPSLSFVASDLLTMPTKYHVYPRISLPFVLADTAAGEADSAAFILSLLRFLTSEKLSVFSYPSADET